MDRMWHDTDTGVTDETGAAPGGVWDERFRDGLGELIRWRRDTRRFRTDALDPETVLDLLRLAALAPSVGNAQPWRFVLVETPARRTRVAAIFERENAEAASVYADEQARLYASLKLAGLCEAPVHLAVFCDDATGRGSGLGRRTMPETLRYSVVCAVHTLWLAARARGIAVGWVSILDPAAVADALGVAPDWTLVAYLCLGLPQVETLRPELDAAGWEARLPSDATILRR